MTAKIRELKLDDIKNVAGGAIALSTSTTTYMSASSLLIKPTSTTSWSSNYQSALLAARL
jgi:hypothetical protein